MQIVVYPPPTFLPITPVFSDCLTISCGSTQHPESPEPTLADRHFRHGTPPSLQQSTKALHSLAELRFYGNICSERSAVSKRVGIESENEGNGAYPIDRCSHKCSHIHRHDKQKKPKNPLAAPRQCREGQRL